MTPSGNGCDSCKVYLEISNTWVHLRPWLMCGRVGCCDDSSNEHATKQFHAAGHPITQ